MSVLSQKIIVRLIIEAGEFEIPEFKPVIAVFRNLEREILFMLGAMPPENENTVRGKLPLTVPSSLFYLVTPTFDKEP